MRVTVRVPAVLRADCGDQAALVFDLDGEATLAGLFSKIAVVYPRLERRIRDERGEIRRYVNVYINGTESRHCGGMKASLDEGAVVQIIPSVAGG